MSPAFTADTLVELQRVSAIAARPDGLSSVVVVERLDADKAKYVSDLWHVPHGTGAASQLTRGDVRDRAPAFLADGTLLFLSDRPTPGAKAGDEARTQVWLLPRQGDAYPLTDEPHGVSDFKCAGKTLVALVELLPDVPLGEQRKALADKKKNGPSLLTFRAQPVRFWDRWLGPTEPRLVAWDIAGSALDARRDLTPDAGDALREHSWDLSADGARVAITWAVASADDRIHDKPIAVIDTASGVRAMLGVGPGVVNAAPRFTPDGARLVAQRYRRTPDGYAHRPLWLYDVASSAARELTGAWDRWPGPWGIVARTVVTTAEDNGRSPVFLVDVETGGEVAVGPRGVGPDATGSWDFVALVPGKAEIVGVRSDLLSPPEPWHLDLTTGVARPIASLSGFTRPEAMPKVSELRVPVAARDGGGARELQAFVVEPPTPNGRTLLWIHGGPVASWSEHWHWRWSALVMAGQGYRVVQPNPSGSTGFGIDWVNDIWGNTWGGRCYDDLMRLVAHLESGGTAARDIVVMGGSFGGYMTNWIGGQTDRFRALVAHASIFHMSAFHGVTDMPAWWELMMGGSPWTDPDYDRYSPSRYIARWKTPTLIIHGEKDYRVPVGEALALFEALQAHGVRSELALFPDEHHWIMKPKNIAAWYRTVLDFIDRAFAS